MAIIRATKKERRDAILCAALDVFLRDGFARAKVEEIAQLAKVGKGTVFEHFGNKEKLFFALLEQKAQAQIDELHALSDCDQGEDAATALKKLFRAFIQSLEQMIPLIGLCIEAWHLASTDTRLRAQTEELFRGFFVPLREQVAALLSSGRRQGGLACTAPKDTAALMLAIIDGLAFQSLFILKPSDLPRMARRAEGLLFSGLDPRS